MTSCPPLVTVYLSTYNRRQLLERAVASVLDQDYQNIELIIVDDGSSDGTREYLNRLVASEKMIRAFLNETNKGACACRNIAIKNASGVFITGLDDDDFFLPNRISDFINSWNDCSTVIGLYSDSLNIAEGGVKEKTKRASSVSQRDLLYKNAIGNQVFVKTDYIRSKLGFDENFGAWQDLECWYRLLDGPKMQMKKTNSTTYVFDQSHPHERISTKSFSKIEAAYQKFTHKHTLSTRDASILASQKYSYAHCPYGVFDLFVNVFNSRSFFVFAKAIQLLFLKTKNKLSCV